MKLNKNSFSSKFYKWFYETSILPNNLCPYFWKLLLAWVLVALFGLPSMVLLIPFLIVATFNKNALFFVKDNKYGAILVGFILYIALFVLMCIIIFFLTLFNVIPYVDGSNIAHLQIWGGIFSFFGFVSGIVYLSKYLAERKKTKVKQPNIITEFVKAKYNKYCPKIDWE